jgi:hypothetical protein
LFFSSRAAAPPQVPKANNPLNWRPIGTRWHATTLTLCDNIQIRGNLGLCAGAMGYFDEELSPKAIRPKPSRHMERQIGAFFVAWSVLENELDLGFPVPFRIDPTLASVSTVTSLQEPSLIC